MYPADIEHILSAESGLRLIDNFRVLGFYTIKKGN